MGIDDEDEEKAETRNGKDQKNERNGSNKMQVYYSSAVNNNKYPIKAILILNT